MSEPTPGTRSYRPGDWYAVFGAQVTVLLPPSEKPRVAAVWELVDAGAGFDETLDRLISGGLRQLPGFVLLGSIDGETKIVVRGPARAVLTIADGPVVLEGAEATTWVERSLRGVIGIEVMVPGDSAGAAEDGAAGPELPIDCGLVRVAGFREPAYADAPAPQAETAPEPPTPTPPSTGPILPPPLLPPPPPLPPAPSGELPTDLVPALDHDGLTHAGEPGADALAPPRPGIPGQPPAPDVTARPVARLVLPDGERVDVDRVVVVGRAPEARRFSPGEEPRLVTVPSPQQEISATHLEVRPGSGADHSAAVVTDLGSTNGTVLVQPGLRPETLIPGVAVQLLPGAVIDLGDGVTIQVDNP